MANQQGSHGRLRELALFAGAGGGILGGKLLGWRTVCAVELDAYAAAILAQRQNDGCLEPFPIWSGIQTFDGRPWRGLVDVVSGGFPCQDISCAGKGSGITGERSGLWKEMARIIGEVRPRYVFVENSPMLTSRGLGTVLGDLAAMGYDAEWGVLGAHHAGAPHKRDRIWVVAYTKGITRGLWLPNGNEKEGNEFVRSGENVANPSQQPKREPANETNSVTNEWETWNELIYGSWWSVEPDVDRVVNGMAFRVDRLKAIGNGQVPIVAKLAWEILTERM